jgi:hypothetical protein
MLMLRLASSRSFLTASAKCTSFRTTASTSARLFASSSTAPPMPSAGVFSKIACLGTGKMASAVLAPMVNKGVQPAEHITIFDVNLSVAEQLSSEFGFVVADNIQSLVADADLVILAVKPQNLTPAFWHELQQSDLKEEAIALSIIAGKPIDSYRQGGFNKIVRSMPNTPATIGEGMTVWSATPNLNKEERKKIRTILSSCGKSVRLLGWISSSLSSASDTGSSLTHSLYPFIHCYYTHRCTWMTSPSLTWRPRLVEADQPTFSCSWNQ